MEPGQALAFLVFAVVAAVTPGPSNVMLVAAGTVGGVAGGLPCLLGVSAGMGLLVFAVALGLGGLVLADPLVLTGLNWLGAAFLLWLSWRIATAPAGTDGTRQRPVGFLRAALFQLVNPKAWLVGMSGAGAYLTGKAALPEAVWLAALFVAAALPSGFLWLAFGAAIHRHLRSPRTARLFNVVMGASLAASVLLILG